MSEQTKFDDIQPPLSEGMRAAIASFGFTRMTPVQASTIPLFLKNKDVLVEATTGSGKTLAFAIPILEILSRSKQQETWNMHDIGALVLAPTRELACQIYDVINALCKHNEKGLTCARFVGGSSIAENIAEYRSSGGQIIIGTPGRVLDMIKRSDCPLNAKTLEVLVLDEADTLLDMGFRDSINELFGLLPKQRRTGLFSATQTREVKELARAGLRNPVSVSVKVQRQQLSASASGSQQQQQQQQQQQLVPSTLDNSYIICAHEDRPQQLVNFIMEHAEDKIIVFCATCACVDFYSMVFEQLAKEGRVLSRNVNIRGFHGKMVPKKRNAVYTSFVELPAGVMFSTDVAARGVDIPDVDWIVQMAAPKDPSFFVHRVGRTARAGRRGGAVLFVSEEELPYIELLQGRGVPLREQPSTVRVASQSEKGPIESDSTAPSAGMGSSGQVDNVLEHMKKIAMTDRTVLETGTTAFMSFLRAYKENLCSYIFRFDALDIGSVARAYALLRLPKIPETRDRKGKKPIVFEPAYVDTTTIPYLHKEKEKARQRRLAVYAEEQKAEEAEFAAQGGDANDAASFRTWKSAKSGWIPAADYRKMKEEEAPEKRKRKKKEGLHKKIVDEWDDLAAEEMAYKKFKRGKISKAEYENCLTSEKQLKLDPLTGDPILDDSDNDGDDISKGGSGSGSGSGSDSGSDSDAESTDAIQQKSKQSQQLHRRSSNRKNGHCDESDESDGDDDDDDWRQKFGSAAGSVSGASTRTGQKSHKSYTKSIRSKYSRAGSTTSQRTNATRASIVWKRKLGSMKSNATSSIVTSLKPLKKKQRKIAARRKR